MLLSGLSANSTYTYTLTVTSRGDIPPVSGSFTTSAGGDTIAPQTLGFQLKSKDPYNRLFGTTFTEILKALERYERNFNMVFTLN